MLVGQYRTTRKHSVSCIGVVWLTLASPAAIGLNYHLALIATHAT